MNTIEFEGDTYDLTEFKHPGGSIIHAAYLNDATMLVHSYHPNVDCVRKAIAQYRMNDSKKDGGTKAKKASYKGPLYAELKKRVHNALQKEHQSPGADCLVRFKMIVLVMGFVSSYLWLAFSETEFHIQMAAISLGSIGALIGMAVMHDASHMAIETGSLVWLNYVWQFSGELIGLSTLGWRYQHCIQHHLHTDDEGDPDTAFVYPLMRTKEDQEHLLIHYFQSLFLLPLTLGLIGIYHIWDTCHVITGIYTWEGLKKPDGTRYTSQEWFQFALSKLSVCLQWTMLFHKGGFQAWLLYCVCGSLILSSIDVPTHYTTHPPLPDKLPKSIMEGDVVDCWLLDQLHRSNSFEPGISWIFGGLNMQIEHHLFPRLSHRHYPYLMRPILQEFCQEHGLPYNDYSHFGVIYAVLERMILLSFPTTQDRPKKV